MGYARGASNEMGVKGNRFPGADSIKIAAPHSFQFLNNMVRLQFNAAYRARAVFRVLLRPRVGQQRHGSCAREAAGDGHIRKPVPIEVRDGHRNGGTGNEGRLPVERAIAIAQKEPNHAVREDSHIRLAVSIEVGYRERGKWAIDLDARQWLRLPESGIAVTQVYGLRCHYIQNSVAIQVGERHVAARPAEGVSRRLESAIAIAQQDPTGCGEEKRANLGVDYQVRVAIAIQVSHGHKGGSRQRQIVWQYVVHLGLERAIAIAQQNAYVMVVPKEDRQVQVPIPVEISDGQCARHTLHRVN